MGKPTGFLEYNRKNNPQVAPRERIENYNEFHPMLMKEQRQEQGARCMNCGVPFCQSAMVLHGMVTGCPLHNLIPEWNDEIYQGNWKHALSRLLKNNSFPEFTGRVCPALCEAACTSGLYDEPVTIKENELFIIEHAFNNGYMSPKPPKVRTDKKIAIIGSGPSGLACADKLNKRGHNVTIYEKDDRAGGLLMYGIPNMKLEKDIVARRIKLMEDEGITFITGKAISTSKEVKALMKNYDAVIICCGAGTPRDIKAEGRDSSGIHFAVDFLTSTTKSLLSDKPLAEGSFISAKGKNVVVIGGGDTGNDCVATSIRHGCKSVCQIEMMPKPPLERASDNQWPSWPKVLKTDYGQEEAIEIFGKDPRIFETTVKSFIADDKGQLTGVKIVKLASHIDEKGNKTLKEVEGSEKIIDADLVLIAAGFLGPDPSVSRAFGLKTTERSNISTLENSFATSAEGIFTCGDARRGQSLVVWAISEGSKCAKEVDKYLMNYTNMI